MNNQSRRARLWAAVLSIAVEVTRIAAAYEPQESVIQSRISNFRELGTAYKSIRDELQAKNPDLMGIHESAELIGNRGADMLLWFPPGSEPVATEPKSWLDSLLGWFASDESATSHSEAQSHARHGVWAQPEKFRQAHREFQSEAVRFAMMTQSQPVAAIGAQFRKLGETCKACHDVYRKKLD